jgi:tetratricopeptide (TPR) repeat protein
MTDRPARFKESTPPQTKAPDQPKLPPEKLAHIKRAAESQIDAFLRQVGVIDVPKLTDPDGWRYFTFGSADGRTAVLEHEGELFLHAEAVVMQLPSDKDLLLPLMRELLEFNLRVSGSARLGIVRDYVFVSIIQTVLHMRTEEFSRVINMVMQLADELDDKLIEKYGGTTKPRLSIDQAKVQPDSGQPIGGAGGDTVYLLQLGKTHFEAAEYDRALTAFEQVLRVDEQQVEAQVYRAQCLNYLGQYAEAYSAANKALRLNKNLPLAYVARGYALLRQGNAQAGLEELDKAVQIDPKQARALLVRGQCHEALRDWEKAASDYSQTLGLTTERDALATAYQHRCLCYRVQGKLDAALKDINQALHIYPEAPVFLCNRGQVYHAQGQLERALFDLSEAIQVLPQPDPYYYYRRGLVHFDMRNYERALDDYAEALHIDAAYVPAQVESARAWWALGEVQQAVTDCNKAIQLDQNFADAYGLRAAIRRSQREYQMAIRDYDTAIHLAPQWAEMYLSRGLCRLQLDDDRAALSDFNAAIRYDPQPVSALLNRGLILLRHGDVKNALDDLNEAIRIDPNHAHSYYHRGLAWRAKGDPKKAAADFQKALELQPDHPEADPMRGFIAKYGGRR